MQNPTLVQRFFGDGQGYVDDVDDVDVSAGLATHASWQTVFFPGTQRSGIICIIYIRWSETLQRRQNQGM